MPERHVSETNLKTGAVLAGGFLAGWAIFAAVLSLTDRTQIGTTLTDMGLSHWIIPTVLIVIALLQIWGHVARARWILVAADLAGGLVCAISASVLGHSAMHGGVAAIAALNWMFVSCIFLLHTVMLRTSR